MKMCAESDLLRTLPAIYERWDSDRIAGRPIQIEEERIEKVSLHNYSQLETCFLAGRCHFCAIIWSEMKSEAGNDPLDKLRDIENGEEGHLVAVLKRGGKSCINYCLLSFEVGGNKVNTYMQVLMSDGKSSLGRL
jgi:hypothetical protein